jgi:hypothetical protein
MVAMACKPKSKENLPKPSKSGKYLHVFTDGLMQIPSAEFTRTRFYAVPGLADVSL